MSSAFLVIECYKCKEVRQITWPFHNVLKLFCDSCDKCDKKFKLHIHSKDIEDKIMGIPAREFAWKEADIPKRLCHERHSKTKYCSLAFDKEDLFYWCHLEKEELKFPLLVLDFGMFVRKDVYNVSTGVVLLEDMENFLNEPNLSW